MCSADQLEMTQGGLVQAKTTTVRCFMKSCRQPAHLQQVNYLFYFAVLCNGVMAGRNYSWRGAPNLRTVHVADVHIKKPVLNWHQLGLKVEKNRWKLSVQSSLKLLLSAHRDYCYIHLPRYLTRQTFLTWTSDIVTLYICLKIRKSIICPL